MNIPEHIAQIGQKARALDSLILQLPTDEPLTVRDSIQVRNYCRQLACLSESLHSLVAGNPAPKVGL